MKKIAWILGILAALTCLAVGLMELLKVKPAVLPTPVVARHRKPAAKGPTFNSTVDFDVYAQKTTGDPPTYLGRTPSFNPIAIPDCLYLMVKPIPHADVWGTPSPIDREKVLTEVRDQKIPGVLCAEDEDLARWKGVESVKAMTLRFMPPVYEDPRLQAIETRGFPAFTDESLAHLADMASLQFLDLTDCRITDAGLAHLEKLTEMQYLILSGCEEVTNAGLVHLEGVKSLQVLDLSRNYRITDTGLARLSRLTSLQKLELSHSMGLTDSGIANLKKALPNAAIIR
jgi:hypothetical protein